MASKEVDTSGSNQQYNDIADSYSKLYPPGGKDSPFLLAPVEEAQIRFALTDPKIDIKGKRMLELACGSGYYSSKLLTWGAESVTGVDLSSVMIDAAKADAKTRDILESKLGFVQGDATDTDTVIEGAPFDIVTGCWLLNYAPNAEVMTKMWTTIGRHLKPGGVFVGMTPPPLLSDGPFEEAVLRYLYSKVGAWGKYGNGGQVLEAMPNGDGYKALVQLGDPEQGQEVTSFENYHLRMGIYEEACAASGMFTRLEWRDYVIPEDVRASKPVGFWNDLVMQPTSRVCVARRKS